MRSTTWWEPPWDSKDDPDSVSVESTNSESAWHEISDFVPLTDDAILKPLEEQFGKQLRSKERVRDLAEVFTDKREIDAMLDLIPDAFSELDIKFLEPTCGSGNFLVEILNRKLKLVTKNSSRSQEHFEHRLLRAAASIYGVDISPENVADSRLRMAHHLLMHYQTEVPKVEPTEGFLNAAALIIGDNVILGDSLNGADLIEMCDWQPRPNGCFVRVWSTALVPENLRDLFWEERVQDKIPVHYRDLTQTVTKGRGGKK